MTITAGRKMRYIPDPAPTPLRLRDIASPEDMRIAIPDLWEHLIYLYHARWGEVVQAPRWPAASWCIVATPPEYARRAVRSAYRVNPGDSARLSQSVADTPIYPETGGELVQTIEKFTRYIDACDRIACGTLRRP